ncbi:diguanylate cyclase [Sulfurimonas sp.]|nr:diguanylate cyclase [Sulfurimonas sp.]
MKKVLVVDDSKLILQMLEIEFEQLSNVEVLYADSYSSAMRLMRKNKNSIHMALLDVSLPDAPNGEVISLANLHNIPSIVLTGTMNENVKKLIKKNDVLSYVLKGTPKSTKQAVKLVQRALDNYDVNILIIDDSDVALEDLSNILHNNNINVLTASSGKDALSILEKTEEKISVVFVDFNMPGMDGLEVTIKLREIYEKDQLSIIGVSDTKDKTALADFLKFGANDFISKPYMVDEVTTRLNSNLELLDLFTKISDMANKDFLTGAYNRRYFYDSGAAIFAKAKRKHNPLAVAMLDIDNFKNINDTYGHDVGDIAIKEIKRILDKHLRASDLMARFGGEEFCIVLEDISEVNVDKLFEKIRKMFESNVIISGEVEIKYTVSFGIVYGLSDSLEQMVVLSDEALYESKENGRNQVTIIKT